MTLAALATGWAASLAKSYAPELNIVGAAMGGTPADVAGTLRYLDGTLYSGFGFAGAAGLIASYPDLRDLFNSVATQAGKDAVALAYTQCASQDLVSFVFKKLQSTEYSSLGDKLLDDPVVKKITDNLIMGAEPSETPEFPLYVFHAKTDEVIPVADITKSVKGWCDNGIKSLHFVVKQGASDHISEGNEGGPAALAYVKGLIDGTVEPVEGCVTTEVP